MTTEKLLLLGGGAVALFYMLRPRGFGAQTLVNPYASSGPSGTIVVPIAPLGVSGYSQGPARGSGYGSTSGSAQTSPGAPTSTSNRAITGPSAGAQAGAEVPANIAALLAMGPTDLSQTGITRFG